MGRKLRRTRYLAEGFSCPGCEADADDLVMRGAKRPPSVLLAQGMILCTVCNRKILYRSWQVVAEPEDAVKELLPPNEGYSTVINIEQQEEATAQSASAGIEGAAEPKARPKRVREGQRLWRCRRILKIWFPTLWRTHFRESTPIGDPRLRRCRN